MRSPLVVILALLLIGGCEILSNDSKPDAGEGDLVWTAKVYTGGRQCGPRVEFEPPDIEDELGDADVRVFDTEIRMHAVCEACSCPSYSATHYAQIRESNLGRAESVGFEASSDPAAE